MKDEELLKGSAAEMHERYGLKAFNRLDLEDMLSKCDKDLFVNFRDKEITFDQLKARVAERTGIATYTVYDDI